MEKSNNFSSVLEILGPTFKGTVIEDPVLDPYFITYSGGFTVSKKRLDPKGNLKYRDLCYPSSFLGCLDRIAKEKLHEDGTAYSTVQEYIEKWKEISNTLLDAYKNWEISNI